MCGVDFILCPSSSSLPEHSESITRRGPDAKGEYLDIDDARSIRFFSTVLHLRGEECVQQPLVNERYVLQWNGEVYDGLDVSLGLVLMF